MNINGVPGQPVNLRGITEGNRPEVERSRSNGVAAEPTSVTRAGGTQETLGSNRPQAALPAEPPPGTDPELWSILSAEERVYFAKLGAMGPLTYGRLSTQMQAQPPMARGGRLNVTA